MKKRLAWVALALLATYLVFVGGNWWGIYTPALRIVTMVSAAGLLATWAYVAWRNPGWRPRSVLFPAIAACLASLAISTVFSRSPRVSLEYLGYAIVLAALYLLLVRLFADPFFRQRIPVLASMLFVVIVGAFLVRVALTWIEWWTLVGHISMPPLRPSFEALTFGNPSAVLTMVVLLAVPAAATFAVGTRPAIAVLAGIIASIALVALISGSRAGWFALGVTVLVMGPLWLSRRDNRAILASALSGIWSNRAGRVALVGITVGGLVLAVLVTPTLVRRLTEGGEANRITFSMAALRMFAESPLVGTGPGTWVIQRMAYTSAGEVDEYIPHAHNLESQSLAELGLVGMIAAVVLVANVVWLLRAAMSSEHPDRRRWAWLAAIGLAYFVLHQVFDLYVNMPAFLFAAALPIAYLDATNERSMAGKRVRSPMPRLAWGLAGLLVAITTVGLVWQEAPALSFASATEAANRGDWAAADPLARAAAAADPDIGSYQLTAGLTADRAGDRAYALRAFERVANRDDLPEAWLNAAAEQAALGQTEIAIASIRKALRLGIQRPAVAVPAGDLALRLGDVQLATEAFAAALSRIPSFAGDPWWQEDPTRLQALTAAANVADSTAPPDVRWELALMSGNASLATSLTGGAGAAGFAPDVVRAWTGDPSAGQRVIDACGAQPLELAYLLWCARIENRLGNSVEATAFRRQAEIVRGSSGVNGGEFRVARVEYNKIPGASADLWGLFTYRRPTPWDILVPSLVHLTSL